MADETQSQPTSQSLFSVSGETAVVIGGGGVLGGALARALGQAGGRVAVVGRRAEPAQAVAEAIRAAGGVAQGYVGDALDRAALARTADEIAATLGPVGVLVNAAGGNTPQATTTEERAFFDLDIEALRGVFDGNLLTTIVPCQVFGRGMAERGRGAIVNIASMSGVRPLTRIPAYSAAKAAVVNFTQWLAVHMAQEYSPEIRVNALAPGFFLTEQNRYLLTNRATGAPTPRAQTILAHTPMARLGQPDDLVGALLWLASPAAAFVTGIVVPVDGGFAAFGGV
ncbi:MAG TPA: SDR family NAD(P)-dependent oxidoreductase [Ktedonobacterales bacterium]|nr:SDR family NAD(P)-dependent oxidoreductase [Ktedonobacterales bacterium]